MLNELCFICGSRKTIPYFGADSRLYQCQECHTVALASRLRIRDLENYYTSHEVYRESFQKRENLQAMVDVAHEYLTIISKFITPAYKKLLDVGAGYGVLTQEASRLGFDAFGIEKNHGLVIEAQKRGINLKAGDPQTLSLNGAFDVISMMHVLEHLLDPRLAIKKMNAALVQRGLLVLEVPNIESYLARRHKLSWKYIALEHIFYFSPKTFTKLLEEEGFKVLAVTIRNHFIKTLSLRHLFYYIFGTQITRDRFLMKERQDDEQDITVTQEHFIYRLVKKIIKKILMILIRILKREDFILIVARKK